jgi:hypothetical protein
MREPRGQLAKIADTITSTMRRRQRDREPRVLVYDAELNPRLIQPADPAHAEIVDAAERIVALTRTREEGEPQE